MFVLREASTFIILSSICFFFALMCIPCHIKNTVLYLYCICGIIKYFFIRLPNLPSSEVTNSAFLNLFVLLTQTTCLTEKFKKSSAGVLRKMK